MSKSVPTPAPRDFNPARFPRYTFDSEAVAVRDTKYHRDVAAKSKRGGEPYYRLKDADDAVAYVLASDIFGDGAVEIEINSEFDPCDYADRYDFGWEDGVVYKIGTGTELTLHTPHGWAFYYLTRNDGHRVKVTPAEVRQHAANTTMWEVPAPPDARVFPSLFPGFAFHPNGSVSRIQSTRPIIRPRAVPLSDHIRGLYQLRSISGKSHNVTKSSIVAMLAKP